MENEKDIILENPDSSAIDNTVANEFTEGEGAAPAPVAEVQPTETGTENFSENLGNANETEVENNDVNTAGEFAKENKEEENKEEEEKKPNEEDDDKKKKEDEEKYSLLEKSLEEQKAAYAELEAKYQALVEFKNEIDLEKKNALISEFAFLSDEDLADVKTNIAKYSLDEIESKLSVIAVRKKVNFAAIGGNDDDTQGLVNLESLNNIEDSQPEWVKAVQAHSN